MKKEIDSWADGIIFSNIASPITNLLPRNKYIPYLITLLTFLFRIIAGFLFYFNHIYSAVLFIILGAISDAVDGQSSRKIFGKDPELRGTLDFILDHISVVFIYVGLGNIIPKSMYILFIFLLASHVLLMALTSTKFRLTTQAIITTGVTRSIQDKFRRFGLIMHPCIGDSNLILWVLFPLFGFNIWLIIIATIIIWIDILGVLVSIWHIL